MLWYIVILTVPQDHYSNCYIYSLSQTVYPESAFLYSKEAEEMDRSVLEFQFIAGKT